MRAVGRGRLVSGRFGPAPASGVPSCHHLQRLQRRRLGEAVPLPLAVDPVRSSLSEKYTILPNEPIQKLTGRAGV